jgi:hypothetical protein
MAKVMEETQTSRWRNWAKAAHLVYPESSFTPAEAILSDAALAAQADKEASARVDFLKQGLAHAKLCVRVSSRISLANPTATKDETEALLRELLTFRRATEKLGIDNFNHLAWVEDLSWKLSDEVKQMPDLYP